MEPWQIDHHAAEAAAALETVAERLLAELAAEPSSLDLLDGLLQVARLSREPFLRWRVDPELRQRVAGALRTGALLAGVR